MKPIDLLSAVDAFAGLGPLEILSHPAWGIPVQWNGEAAVLRADAEVPAETLNLSVRLGEESCVLGLVPSPATPELAKLFPARDQVPPPILLAVEFAFSKAGQWLGSRKWFLWLAIPAAIIALCIRL